MVKNKGVYKIEAIGGIDSLLLLIIIYLYEGILVNQCKVLTLKQTTVLCFEACVLILTKECYLIGH